MALTVPGSWSSNPRIGAHVRTLVIAGEYPWPESSGSRMRLRTTLEGLIACGPTELVSIVPSSRSDFQPPDPTVDLARVARVSYDDRPPSVWSGIRGLARAGIPMTMPWSARRTVRPAVADFMSGHYDLVWIFGVRAWLLSGEPSSGRTILDLDDLEDQKILARLGIPRPATNGMVDRIRRAGATMFSNEEVRRWRRLHRRARLRTDRLVVCSELDAGRLGRTGVTGVAVVPNAYPRVEHPVGRSEVGSPPTVTLQGSLRYAPNVHAARLLVTEIGPLLRDQVPDVEIRLVGSVAPNLTDLDDPPSVAVVGHVPDIGVELARADIIVVPILFGSGTRIKILEAFAQRIPVVSTTLGAEGLGVEDGRHLLIGDDPASIASACARLLTEPDLRERLASSAYDFFLAKFERARVAEIVRDLATEVAGS